MINIITRRQKHDGLEANARLQYGSFNTQKYMGNVGFRKDKFSIFASVNHGRTDGHHDTSDFKITNGYVKATYRISNRFHLFADFNLAGFQLRISHAGYQFHGSNPPQAFYLLILDGNFQQECTFLTES